MNGYGPRGSGSGRPYRGRPGGRRRTFVSDRGGERSQPARKVSCPPDLREPYLEARDFLAGLIAALGLPARLSFGGVDPARDGRQITIEVRSIGGRSEDYRRTSRDARGDVGDLAILIGKHGATLDALSAITNAAMHGADSRDVRDVFFSVDVEGYRARRVATLRSIAQRCATRVLREGVALELEPMPPAERRIIHLALASHRDLATESTGVGSQRRVVILPRDSRSQSFDGEDFE